MSGLLSKDVILAIVAGDAIAVNQVLDRYKGYILKLASVYNEETGNTFIDAELKDRLESKLIRAVLKFKI
jgi:hypothetical protein